MIVYFPEPYENELYYSLLARYHSYSTDIAASSTLRELSGTTKRINFDVPMGIDNLISKIKKIFKSLFKRLLYPISYDNSHYKTFPKVRMD